MESSSTRSSPHRAASQEGCTSPRHTGYGGGLFWGDINTGISPASVAKTQSQAGTAQPRTTWTHNLYLRHALLACLHLHWLHFDGSSSIPRVQLKGQGTENPFAYATCFEPAKPGGDGSALQLLEATLSSGGLF